VKNKVKKGTKQIIAIVISEVKRLALAVEENYTVAY